VKIEHIKHIGLVIRFHPDKCYASNYRKSITMRWDNGTLLRILGWKYFTMSLKDILYHLWDDYLRIYIGKHEDEIIFGWLSFEIRWSNR